MHFIYTYACRRFLSILSFYKKLMLFINRWFLLYKRMAFYKKTDSTKKPATHINQRPYY